MIILKKKLAGVTEAGLQRFLGKARRAAGVEGRVSVLITSSAELRELNRRFRRKDEPTDVLSFPSIADGYAGDIAISADIAAEYAKQLGHPLKDELHVLMLHGVLHLAGYDHHGSDTKMERLEAKLRQELRLPVTLIERARQTVRNAGRKKR